MPQAASLLARPEPLCPDLEAGVMSVEWDKVSLPEWDELLARVPRSTLEQGAPYGEAVRCTRLLVPRRGVIGIGGEAVGLVQMQEIDTLGLGIAVIERGPLWFARNVPALWWRQFLDLFADAHRGFGRVRRFVPELPASDINGRMVQTAGFIARPGAARRSIWIDLKAGEEGRWRALRADWRAALRASEKARLKVEIDERGSALNWLMTRRDRSERSSLRSALSTRFTAALAQAHFEAGTGLLFQTVSASGPLAGALVLVHGKCATYRHGWSSAEGNVVGALHFLMWRAMQHLEERGIAGLDLGWFTSKTREDIIAFKRGLGGEAYELMPVFR